MSIFTKIKARMPRRSNFDLSHDVKLTTEFARLTPFLLQEVMPGDTFKLQSQVFCRMAPMLAPIMSRVDVYTHFFFVPMRLLWDKWEEFITGGEDGHQTPPMPYATYAALCDSGYVQKGDLPDYLGIPIPTKDEYLGNITKVSLLPFRAYQKIWNDWYRDETLEEEFDFGFDQSGQLGTDDSYEEAMLDLLRIRQRAWQKDYFTSALPWPQRGSDVTIPFHSSHVSTSASIPNGSPAPSGADIPLGLDAEGKVINYSNGTRITLSGNAQGNFTPNGPTVNELRRSLRVQEWLEKNARGGARYIEQIFSHFGVKSSDARLQRAELLGGGRSPILISDVEQTSATEQGISPQGNLAGKGTSAQVTHGFKKFFEEHGYVIGIMSIMPKASYQQGLHRLWSREDKFDFAWPEFGNLGEQEILRKELYLLDNSSSMLESVFGYAPRYSEYKYQPSTVHGDFRDSLRFWHLGRYFKNRPSLNGAFIHPDASDLNRIFAVQTGTDHFWIQVYNHLIAKRPLPYYGVPTI